MMAPRIPINQIIHGDCIEILNRLPEGSVDLIFADPPYNLQLQQELWRPNHTKVDAVNDEWDQFDSFEAYDQFTRSWLLACQRVLKNTGTIWVIGTYHNIYRVGSLLQNLGYWILNDVTWIKTNPMPNFRGVRFTNAQETLIWAQKVRGASYTFNHHVMRAINGDLQMRSDWYLPLCSGKERIKISGSKVHSAQKPEALLYRILMSSSNPGDVVLDPFFGTGTTGAVAKKLGRNWIGIELNAGYVDVARRRIEAISEDDIVDKTLALQPSHRKPRVPFGALVERGLLQPGQQLYFDNHEDIRATIMANGHIRYRNQVASIHKIAKEILAAPCNGWDRWYYEDDSGERYTIDRLRENVRAEWAESGMES